MRAAVLVVCVLAPASLACTYSIPGLSSGDDASVGGDDGSAPLEGGLGGGDGTSINPEGGTGKDGSTPGTDAASGPEATCPGDTTCPCSTSGDCNVGLCGTASNVGTGITSAAGGSFCTNPCCNSLDCDPWSVCYASGLGGNYCVDPAWLGRSTTLGTAQGGSACGAGSDCRSGLCTIAGLCADTCCQFGSAECGGPKNWQCAFGDFPGAVSIDQHFTGRCGAPGGNQQYNTSCSSDDQCSGGLCYPEGNFCTEPCSSTNACGGGSSCQSDFLGASDVYFACFVWEGGTEASGTTGCTNDDQCIGGWCFESQCTNICFSDAACPGGWHCLPQSYTFPNGGPTDIMLGCTPP